MPDRIDALLDEAERQPFAGWDFSWLQGRLDSEPMPWDYTETVAARARESPELLDLGTGGGEWLASLVHRPHRTVATEAWPPNVAVAQARLAGIGVHLVQVESARDNTGMPVAARPRTLPFVDGAFHLVVSRHEAFEVSEVVRVLAGGGWFITQQVDVGNDDDYRRLFGVEPEPFGPADRWESWCPDQLRAAGLRVLRYESAPLVQVIRDVGALAWGLRAIPWMVPGYSIERYRDRLRAIQLRLDRDGPITVTQRRFWIEAVKPL
jgi:SAM-dependent methyltransferase